MSGQEREALKPCPFCGGRPSLRADNDGRWTQVDCTQCGARGPELPNDPPGAIRAWNRRPAGTVAPLEREELRAEFEAAVGVTAKWDEELGTYCSGPWSDRFEGWCMRAAQPAAVPVAVVGSGFQLLWTGGNSFAEHAREHGIKVGSPLYTAPQPAAVADIWFEISNAFREGLNGAKHADVATAVHRMRVAYQDAIEQLQPAAPAVPSFWVRRHPDGTLTDEVLPDSRVEQVRKDSGAWVPLHVGAAPAVPQAPACPGIQGFVAGGHLERAVDRATARLAAQQTPSEVTQAALEVSWCWGQYGWTTETSDAIGKLSAALEGKGVSADERRPLSDIEIIDAAEACKSQYRHGGSTYDDFDYLQFARAIEHAHGIKEQP